MKLSRLLLIIVGAIVLLGVVAVGLALTPSVQRWAVLKATAGTPGLKLELTRVSAGFSRAELRDVKVEQDGLVAQIASLEAEYSLTEFLFNNRLHVKRLSANGIVVDASKMKSTEAAATPAAAPGVLSQITLPFELILDDVNLDGKATLPVSAGAAPLEAAFKVSGGRFAPNQEGTLNLNATVKNPASDAPVSTLVTQVTLRATETTQRTFSKVNVSAVLDAEGKTLTEQTQLKVAADLSQDAAGETYVVNVDTLIQNKPENVLALRAVLPAGKKEFTGQWTLKARRAQLAPFALGFTLPEFAATGDGQFVFSPDPVAVSLQGKLDATLSQLEVIDPAWKALGVLKTNVVFDLAEANNVAKLNQLKVTVAGDKPVLDLQTRTTAEFDLVKGSLKVGGTGVTDILTLKLQGVPLSWVKPFATGFDISGGDITGEFVIASDSEGHLMLRSSEPLRIPGLTVVQQGTALLTKTDISLRPEALLADQEVQAAVKQLTLKTAANDNVSAEFSAKIPLSMNPPYVVTAKYTADLPTLLATWVPIGRVRSNGEVDLTYHGDRVDLRNFSTRVADGDNATLLTASSVRAFGLDLVKGQAITGDTKPVDLIKVSLGTIALSKLPLNQPDLQVGGMVNSGEFVLATEGTKMILRSPAPLKLSGVSLKMSGQSYLNGVNIQLQPTAEVSEHFAGSAKTGDVRIANDKGVVILSLQGEATSNEKDGVRGAMTFNLDVPALGSQPGFAGAQAVTQGKASGEIRAALGATKQVEARLTVNGLVARDAQQVLPVANLSARAVVQPDGKISVQAPLLLDRAGQRSDLNFALDLQPKGAGYTITGKLNGEHIEISDLMAVAGVFQTAPAPTMASTPTPAPANTPKPTTPATPTVPDTKAVWSDFGGQIVLDVKSVTQGTAWSMTGLTGLIVAEPTRLNLQKFDAKFDEKSNVTAKGDLTFVGGQTPYKLNGEFALTEFDAGKFFKALEPNEAPTLEGIVNIQGKAQGTGRTLQDLVDRTQGQFQLSSRQGVFRGIKRVQEAASLTTKAADFLGSFIGGKVGEKIGGGAAVVDQIAQALGEIPYDQLTINVARDEVSGYKLNEFVLMSLDVRLAGSGQVSDVQGKSFFKQTLNASLSLGARGKLAESLNKLGILESTKDELGYAKSKEPLVLGGTPSRPNPTPFFTRLLSLKINDMLTR